MAVAVDATGTLFSSGPTITSFNYSGITVGSGSNRALVFMIYFQGGAAQPSAISVTWDSGGTNQAMAQRVSGIVNTNELCAIYVLRAPTPGNKTLAVTWTNAAGISAGAISFTGVDQTSDAIAFPNTNTATATSTAPSLTITSATTNIAVANVGSGGAASAFNQTLLWHDTASIQEWVAQRATTGASSIVFSETLGTSVQWRYVGCDVAAVAAAQNPLNQNVGLELKPWPVKGTTRDLSVPLNPNLFKNPVPTFNGDQSSSRNIPRWLPYPQDGLNINLFKNPVPTLNLYDQAHPFWPSPYRPRPDGLNPNLQTNPFPVFNGDQSSGAKVNPDWAPYPQVGTNPNLFTNPVPFLNQFTPVSDIPNHYPVDQALNINLFTNPYPVLNQFVPVKQPPWTWPGDQALNINLFTNPYPFLNLTPPPAQAVLAKPLDAVYNQNLYTVVVVVAQPFLNLFQPPFVPGPAKPTPDGLNPNLFTNPVPVLNQFTPVTPPYLYRYPGDLQLNPNLLPPSAVQIPFSQVGVPPSFSVPIAPISQYNNVLFDASVPVANQFVPATAPFPYRPVDAPYNLNLYGTPVVTNPVVATDVFTPFSIRPSTPPAPGLNPNLFTNPLPLNQFHHPRTTRVAQAPINLDFPFNPNLPPPTVTTTLIQRTLTGVGL